MDINTSFISDVLGLQGGGPIDFLPVITLADFSESAIGEFIEARGVGGAQASTTTGFTFCDFYLWAREPLVINDVRCLTSGDVGTALNTAPYTTIEPATWCAQVLQITPGALNASLAATDVMSVGSRSISSEFYAHGGALEATLQAAPTLLSTDRESSGIGSVGDVHSFTMQPGVRWFLPPGSGVRIFSNSRPTGGTVRAQVSLTWRELAPAAR